MSMHINNHALKSVERQRNAAGRLDSRFVGAARKWESSRVESRESIVAAGCWMLVWQMNRFESTNKWFMCIESIERIMWKLCSCLPACPPAKLTKFASLSLAAREPCGKVFFLRRRSNLFGGSLPRSQSRVEWAGTGSNGSWSIQDSCAITSCLFWPTLISKSLCSGPKRKLTEPKIRMDTETAENRTETHKNTTRTTRGHEAIARAESWGCRRTRHRVDFITHNGGIDFVTYYLLCRLCWQLPQWQQQLPQWLGLLRRPRGRLTALVCCIFCAKWKSMAWPCFPCETRVVCWTWTAANGRTWHRGEKRCVEWV